MEDDISAKLECISRIGVLLGSQRVQSLESLIINLLCPPGEETNDNYTTHCYTLPKDSDNFHTDVTSLDAIIVLDTTVLSQIKPWSYAVAPWILIKSDVTKEVNESCFFECIEYTTESRTLHKHLTESIVRASEQKRELLERVSKQTKLAIGTKEFKDKLWTLAKQLTPKDSFAALLSSLFSPISRDTQLLEYVTKINTHLALYRANNLSAHYDIARETGLELIKYLAEHESEMSNAAVHIIADPRDRLGTIRFSVGISRGIAHKVSDTSMVQLPPFVSTMRAKEDMSAGNRAHLRYLCVQHQRTKGQLGKCMPHLDFLVYSNREIKNGKLGSGSNSDDLAVLFAGHLIGPTLGQAYAVLQQGIADATEKKNKEDINTYSTMIRDLFNGAKQVVKLWHITPPPLNDFYEKLGLKPKNTPKDILEVYLSRHKDFGRMARYGLGARIPEASLFTNHEAELWDLCGRYIFTEETLQLLPKTIRARMDPWEENFKIDTGRVPESKKQLLDDLAILSSEERRAKIKPVPDPHLSFCHWAEDFIYLLSSWVRHFASAQIRFSKLYGQSQEKLFKSFASNLEMPQDVDQFYLFGFLVNVYGAKLTAEKLVKQGQDREHSAAEWQFFDSPLKQARKYLSRRLETLSARYKNIHSGKKYNFPQRLSQNNKDYLNQDGTVYVEKIKKKFEELEKICKSHVPLTISAQEKYALITQHLATYCLHKLLSKISLPQAPTH